MITRFAVIVMASSYLAACVHPTNRYRFLAEEATEIPTLKVTVASFPNQNPTVVRGLDLAPEAQARLIDRMPAEGDEKMTPQAVTQAMATAYPVKPHSSAKDATRLSRKLVISLSMDRKDMPGQLADRLESVRIIIKPKGGRFVSWDKLETQYGTVDLGSISAKTTFSMAGEITPGAGSFLSGLVGKPTIASEQSGTVNLRQRTIILTGELLPEEAIIHQQGVQGWDLIGNTVFNVDLCRLSPTPWRTYSAAGLYVADIPQPSDKVDLTATDIVLSPRAITADVEVKYTLRHVVKGYRTLEEADDDVVYITDSIKPERGHEVILADAPELAVLKYLGGNIHVAPLHNGEPVMSESKNLLFASIIEAQDFLIWMHKQSAVSVKSYGLVSSLRRPLTVEALSEIEVALFEPPPTHPETGTQAKPCGGI